MRFGIWGRLAGAAAAIAAASTVAGCVPVVVAGAGTGAVVAAQDRSTGDAVDDTVIRTRINKLWLDSDASMYRSLNLNVQEGRVLITGTVPNADQKVTAVRLAWQAEGVKEVNDEIQVGEGGGVGTYAKDSYIATKLRGELTLDGDVSSINYSIEVENGVVYLMGIAQDRAELDRVVDHARNIGLVTKVVSYVRIKGQGGGPPPAATG